MSNGKKQSSGKLPSFFKPIFWSYDFLSLQPDKHKKTIILNTINCGDLKHWRWLIGRYGIKTIQRSLAQTPASAIRRRVLKLAGIIFSISAFNYAPRGTKSKRRKNFFKV